ncbi:DUF4232 domain-containing protein [Streptomyces sp. Q6]|uniref:DUF4232 domain-containing protein n=1 Tax=Streptomyces citrinus TaxID=3118173 RepID=A0ACD5AP90_9ACTN
MKSSRTAALTTDRTPRPAAGRSAASAARRGTVIAAVAVAVVLALTACGGNGSGADSSSEGAAPSGSSSPSSAGSSSPSPSSGSGGSQTGHAKQGSAEGGEAGADAANAAEGSAGTGGGGTFCKTRDLAVDARDAAPDEVAGRIDITMVNRGSVTCSVTGFAGVDIEDADHTSSPIERGPAQPRVTVLKPGDAAVFNLAYTIDPSGKSLASPTSILVTPPNETHTVNLKWPAGAGQIKGAYADVEVYPTHTTV